MTDKEKFNRLLAGQMALMEKAISNTTLDFRSGKCHGMVMIGEYLGLIDAVEAEKKGTEIVNKEVATRSQWA